MNGSYLVLTTFQTFYLSHNNVLCEKLFYFVNITTSSAVTYFSVPGTTTEY